MNVREMLRAYFVAGSQDFKQATNRPQALLDCLEQALKCGLTCYQFREKGAGALQHRDDIMHLAKAAQALCQRYHVPFFIDDDLQLALTLHADGIHVGQGDMPILELIARVQGRMLVGLSTHNIAQFSAANTISGIDYCGFGPIFPTQSKPDADPAVGVEAIRAVRAAGLEKPMVAIGGIRSEDAVTIRAAGADGVAVISAIAQSGDVPRTLAQLLATK
ncbi:thiamine phosphate synthase [Pasteurellaceae bacterium HPA106]|uniref:thiamine phosphate synthase n=1 Tax=Spirabiliibacterium pneumoniae TaxID=221400 RepID=UPI001AAC5BFE|nr:thiamine phosphate synthase [Spirabiliibacterium pneumoniae]MBE2896404.1 thiamine phosphate synthase [Spirabiliibacterium pneumoniae]